MSDYGSDVYSDEDFSDEVFDDFDEESEFGEEAKSPPPKMKIINKKPKVTPKTTSGGSKLLSPNAGVGLSPLGDSDANKGGKKGGKKKTIEDIYQKKTQYEHIVTRPDTYIGSTEAVKSTQWVFDADDKKMVEKEISYVPGLYKIFDEILVNAADNYQRDNSMKKIAVTIDKASGVISVLNDGAGIPIVMHAEEKVMVPEMIFGHLLTSSNYDDDEKKVTGGRNGYGAKLTNIFSTEFTLETADGSRKKVYKQTWTENMSKCFEAKIKPSTKKNENWTKVTFKPDYAKFGMEGLDDDIVSLLRKRVYDVAGCNPKLKVYLDKEYLPIKNFADYCGMYITEADKPKITERCNDRWEICVTLSEGQPQQVSFVNSICTVKGGTHVNHVLDRLTKPLLDALKKKKANVKPYQVKSHLFVFVNCLIENPAFDSQTKETLTLMPSKFGSKCDVSDTFMKKVLKSGVVEMIKEFASFKEKKAWEKQGNATRKRGRVTGIPKLDDANNAGGPLSEKCTLVLTEGDSAKALAQAGIAVVGSDWYGCFPLKGKLLNVREASIKQLAGNEEIANIIKILGLRKGEQYTNTKSLRYGHLMIMTDQDHDGSHIKGLVINLFHKLWPSLLKIPGFLVEFCTPIVKVTKGQERVPFFTIPEYREWKKHNNNGRGWNVKYYKGLGTSTDLEAKEYFSHMEQHQIDFKYAGEEDDKAIQLAFSKKYADERKEWIRTHDPEAHVDHNVKELDYETFINKELVLFSRADCERSIPSVMDGLKPGQRKVLYVCLKQNLVKDYKVAQLAGAVANKAAYHHGEVSLMSTIVNMAQHFVGSNNINLLFPSGQFGTRRQGGKDAASSRYIYTRLSSITRKIFHPLDDDVLKYLDDDGYPVEPEYYAPILPMVLVNGADGIGTGWATFIPNHNPMDVIANLRRMLNKEEVVPLKPWYNGFTGTVTFDEAKGNFAMRGCLERVDDKAVRITELPLRTWTQSYKEWLEKGLTDDGKSKAWVKDYDEHHTSNTVDFEISTLEKLPESEEKLDKMFKLTTTLSRNNYVCFDSKGHIRRFANAEEIMTDFFDTRLQLYHARKAFLTDKLQKEFTKLDNRVRFIQAVISGDVVVANRKKAELLKTLREKGFDPCPPPMQRQVTDDAVKDIEELGADKSDAADGSDDEYDAEVSRVEVVQQSEKDYDYLLSMPIWSLTMERAKKLKAERDQKKVELTELLGTTVEEMWRRDLNELESALEEFYVEQRAAEVEGTRLAAKVQRQRKKAIKQELEDDDFEASLTSATTKKKAAKKLAGSKRVSKTAAAKAKEKDEEDETMFSLSETEKPAESDAAVAPAASPEKKAKVATSGGKAKAVPTKKAKAAARKRVESSDEEEEEDDDDMSVQEVPPPRKRGGGRRAAAKVDFSGMAESDSDEGGEALSLSDDDEDDEAF